MNSIVSFRSQWLPVFIFFVLLFWCSAASAIPRVQKSVVGLDGYLRGDRWVPVVFEIINPGSNFQGTIEVHRGQTVFRKSLDLGANASKRVEILVYQASYFESMLYRIFDDNGRIVREDKLQPRMLNYQDNLLLVVSDSDYNHQFLNGIQNPWGGKTFVAYLKPSDLFSEFIAYSTADAVAIGSMSVPRLDPQQWQSLLLYSASGGTLILSAATDLSVLKQPVLREFMPVISAGLDRISNGDFLVSRWAARTSAPFPEIAIPVQTVQPRPWDTVNAQLDTVHSLISSSSYYKGNIMYFAFDYTRVPEELRLLFAGYWNDSIFPSPAGAPGFGQPFRPRLEDNPRVQRALYDIPGLRLPDMKWFALYFFIYLMAIGPLQYLVLNFLKKNALVWITFPLMIFLFTALAIGYSQYRHSSERKITQISVIESFPALKNEIVYQVYGSAIADSGTFDFQAVPENSYITKAVREAMDYKLEPFVLSEDLPHKLQGESIKSWTFRTFDAIGARPSALSIEVNASIESDTLRGTVRNNTDYTISESFFLYDRSNTKTLGNIAPGQSKEFSFPVNGTSVIPITENHLRTMLDLYSPSYSKPHFFFGQIRDASGKILINERERKTECTTYVAVYVQVAGHGPAGPWPPEYAQPVYRP